MPVPLGRQLDDLPVEQHDAFFTEPALPGHLVILITGPAPRLRTARRDLTRGGWRCNGRRELARPERDASGSGGGGNGLHGVERHSDLATDGGLHLLLRPDY